MKGACGIFIKDLLSKIQSQSMQCFGARNSVGFSTHLENFSHSTSGHSLPSETHITYEGVFNEIKFDVGNKTELVKDLHLGYARYQFSESLGDKEISDYLALFVKGSKDGSDRDERPLNSVICLDISGSMGGGLGGYGGTHKSRLALSVQAIKMFISKLRPNDSVSLITFNDSAEIIFQPMLRSELPQDIYQRLDSIKVCGGTTIRSGFELSVALLKGWTEANQTCPSQNRIIMLTDVCDNSISQEKAFIDEVSNTAGINLTIIGISNEFRSQVCECLKDVKGFNYFCAVKQEDIKKYVFQTFDFGYFPSAYDVNISLKSDDINSFEVFGAPDSDKVLSYNSFNGEIDNFVISKLKSTFPSEIQIVNGSVLTYGGLILLKLKRKTKNPFFKGEISLKYTDPYGKKYDQLYNLNYQFPEFQQYFSQQSLKEAIQAYIFTSQMKTILRQASKITDLSQSFDRYWPVLTALETIIPKSKADDLKNIKKIFTSAKESKPLNVYAKGGNDL